MLLYGLEEDMVKAGLTDIAIILGPLNERIRKSVGDLEMIDDIVNRQIKR